MKGGWSDEDTHLLRVNPEKYTYPPSFTKKVKAELLTKHSRKKKQNITGFIEKDVVSQGEIQMKCM